jgi:hypothetical protein
MEGWKSIKLCCIEQFALFGTSQQLGCSSQRKWQAIYTGLVTMYVTAQCIWPTTFFLGACSVGDGCAVLRSCLYGRCCCSL